MATKEKISLILLGLVIIGCLARAIYLWGFDGAQKSPQSWSDALEQHTGTAAYKSVDRNKPLDQQTVIVEVAGRTFKIPKVYIDTNLGGKRKQDGVNLLYVYPDFTSRANFKDREEYNKAKDERRFGYMLIMIQDPVAPLSGGIRLQRNSVKKLEEKGVVHGLKYEVWHKMTYDGSIRPYYDVYIGRDESNKVLNYIKCSSKERDHLVSYPVCSHVFFDKNLYYTLDYNKEKYFSDWKDIRQKAINFINGFEIQLNPQQQMESVVP